MAHDCIARYLVTDFIDFVFYGNTTPWRRRPLEIRRSRLKNKFTGSEGRYHSVTLKICEKVSSLSSLCPPSKETDQESFSEFNFDSTSVYIEFYKGRLLYVKPREISQRKHNISLLFSDKFLVFKIGSRSFITGKDTSVHPPSCPSITFYHPPKLSLSLSPSRSTEVRKSKYGRGRPTETPVYTN